MGEGHDIGGSQIQHMHHTFHIPRDCLTSRSGETEAMTLVKGNAFARGATDTFQVKGLDIGEPRYLKVQSDWALNGCQSIVIAINSLYDSNAYLHLRYGMMIRESEQLGTWKWSQSQTGALD